MVIPSLADILNDSPLVPSKRWQQGNWLKDTVSYCFGPDAQHVTAGFCARVVLARDGQSGEEVYIAIAPVRYPESERFRTGERDPEDGAPIEKYHDVSHYVTLVVKPAGGSSIAKAFKGKSYKCYNDLAFIGEKVKQVYDEYVAFQQSVTLE
jgi:hypothetical protein